MDKVFLSKQAEVTKASLQSNDNIIVGWLAGAHIRTFNCCKFKYLLQNHPKFYRLPIEVQTVEFLRLHGDSKSPKTWWRKPKVVVINTSRDPAICKQFVIACKYVWNVQTIERA